MAIGDIIVGIDIGTSKVSTFVGEVTNFNQIESICMTSAKCSAIKKGVIVDEDELSSAIAKSIKEAEDYSNFKINSVYTTIPGKYVTIVQNSIVKDAKDKFAGISLNDVSSAIIQVRKIDIPDDKVFIDIVPDKFILEDGKAVEDPVGKFSSNFTVTAQVILGDKEYVRQLTSVFKKAGLDIDGIVPISLAERNLVLDTNELQDNVMILDVGAGNTEIGVFNGSSFIYSNTITLGGNNITSDISYVLGISHEEADKLKRQYGLALKSYIDNDNNIILNTCKDADLKNVTIKSSELIEIIEARVEEIFTLVNKDITSKGINKNTINNVILTGEGITNISKSDIAGKIILNIPVKNSTGRLVTSVKSTYRVAYSLVRYIAARPYAKSVSNNIDVKTERNILKNILEKVKDFFYS
ncbi:MAG: cell division protein FtsA [Clostridia bacterium]|nr:cell division protein FtsA [Clostridia bacterium]